jgi:hypothetical protein
MAIQIFLRHLQLFDISGNPVVYVGTSPANLQQIPGTVPGNTWIDFTDEAGDVDKIDIDFTTTVNSSGIAASGAIQPKKSITATLSFTGDAYAYIKDWLLDHPAGTLNGVDVKITDTKAGDYLGYVIKCSQISWCEDGICQYDITLQQQDVLLQCIQRTVISDNWQGWFQDIPANGKQHPRFSYCVEHRPNGLLTVIWFLLGIVYFFAILISPILLVLDLVIKVIDLIIGFVNSIAALVSGGSLSSVNWNTIPTISPSDLLNDIVQMQVEVAGCGREHPAPLIRDYIQNVCMKCGVNVTPESAEIFFAPTITLTTSSQGYVTKTNPYYNACYMTPILQRGIRRFQGINIFSGPTPNNTQFYLEGNAPLDALDQFLDKIKGVYNAEWRLANNTLYIKQKDWFKNQPGYVYDFSVGGLDRDKIVHGICYTPGQVQYPAAAQGIYSDDMVDVCAREAETQMNNIVSFGNVDLNPNFSGTLNKTVQIGATKFRLDGASTDYIYDAAQILLDIQIMSLATFGVFLTQMDKVLAWIRQYGDYALLMNSDICQLPKILIWDGDSYLNARALTNMAGYPGVSVYNTPQTNPKYPSQIFINGNEVSGLYPWEQMHGPNCTVLGQVSNPVGQYKVSGPFGFPQSIQSALLPNYPQYWEPHFQDNLYDWFHWTDDPTLNPVLNWQWSVKIALCTSDLQKLKVLGDGSEILLQSKVKLDLPYYSDGVINEIIVGYDSSDTYGQNIEIKGTV